MKILVALGGNAILKHGAQGTAEEQFSNVRRAAGHLVKIIEEGNRIALTHGNGPQVGDILLKDEIAKATLPPMPLDVCGAESQGMVGYMIQQALREELDSEGIRRPTVTILTQTVIDSQDQAFRKPSKPVGPFYTARQASRLRREKGWIVVDDSGRGFRRVVPSPSPVEVVEWPTIKRLSDEGVVVIAAGGGGIPVVKDKKTGRMRGVEAVIDKDLTASVLATHLRADLLLILTDVDKVSLNFGKPDEKKVSKLSVEECERYLAEGQFAPGSMGPKIQAAAGFAKRGGRLAVISSLEHAGQAVDGRW